MTVTNTSNRKHVVPHAILNFSSQSSQGCRTVLRTKKLRANLICHPKREVDDCELFEHPKTSTHKVRRSISQSSELQCKHIRRDFGSPMAVTLRRILHHFNFHPYKIGNFHYVIGKVDLWTYIRFHQSRGAHFNLTGRV